MANSSKKALRKKIKEDEEILKRKHAEEALDRKAKVTV
jgi:hypothetical protein